MRGDHSATPGKMNRAGGRLSCAARRERELGALLADVDAFLSRNSIPAPLARRARLVVEELATNAFRHGGAAGGGGVLVELSVKSASPEGSISYAGPAFDPTDLAARAGGDESPIGGHGLRLIQGLTGSLKYAREGGINRVAFEISTDSDL